MAREAGKTKSKKAKKRSSPKKALASRKASKSAAASRANNFLDERLTKALSHWMRVNIMAVASWRVISPSEFAYETGESLSQVSYHFRRLVEYEALEEVETKQVRGAVKHFYRGTRRAIFAGDAWEQLPKSIQDGVAGAALKDFTRVAVSALESGTFSARDDSHLTWDPVTYDELAFKAMVNILATTRERLLALQDEALPRLAKTGQQGVMVAFALSGFEIPRG